jgi:FlaA1/EpsC-like NDP-sugar epimerase
MLLFRVKFLPRWIIFVLDLVCAAAALVLSYMLRFNFNLEQVSRYNLPAIIGGALVVNCLFFVICKSYAGIVRHTSLEDTSRFLLMNMMVSVVYASADIVLVQISGRAEIPYSVVLINFFIINFFMIGYRLLVKNIFRAYSQQLRSNSSVKTKVAIYNTDENGLLTKRVINEYPKSNMDVVAFIDEARAVTNKALEGIPIYNTNEAGIRRLVHEGIELVIIASKNVDKDHLNYLVDVCFKHGIRVQQVPPIQQWIDGRLKPEQLKDIRIEDLLERDVINIENARVKQEYQNKRVLITGAAGSIGSELVRQISRYDPSLLIVCDKAETPLHDLCLELKDKFKDTPLRVFMGDICDRVRMEQLFDVYRPDVVFHAAAYKHVPLMEENPSLAVLNNILGTKNLVEISVANDVEKFVMISTDKAVNPTNIMGASKRIAEIYAQSYYRHLTTHANRTRRTKFITTRFGNVLGSNGSVIPHFKKQLEKGGPLTVTHPDITRYFMTIPEACQLVIEAGTMGQGGEIFVFDMGKPVKIADLARKMILLAGKDPEI